MDGMTSAVDMSAMIWAALQADDSRGTCPMGNANLANLQQRSTLYEGDGGHDGEDENEDDDEDEDDDEIAPVMPQPRGGSGGSGGFLMGGTSASSTSSSSSMLPLPQSFYSTAAGVLPDVVPSYLTGKSPYAPPSSSELFLDEILHSHDDSFHGSTTVDSGDGSTTGNGMRLTTERLTQLEDNYERKKKRAKINRRDLNSRFQELMDLLHLKEDRKLNRAKVMEKAIEHIHKLTSELKAVKAATFTQRPQTGNQIPIQTQRGGQFTGFIASSGRQHQQQTQTQRMPLPLPQWPVATASSGHATLNNMNMAAANPMLWMHPLISPAVSHVQLQPQPQQLQRMPLRSPASAVRSSSTGRGGNRQATTATATTHTQTSPERQTIGSAPVSSVPVAVRRPGLKRSRETEQPGATAPSQLLWIAQEIPTLLELCDAWSLSQLTQVSRELRASGRRDALWKRLCQRRWRLDLHDLYLYSLVPTNATTTDNTTKGSFAQWLQLHRANEMPRCLALSTNASASLLFASGRRSGGFVGLWTSLVRRSNGRTTRTVLVDGRAVVRQVVELNVLIQNLHPCASLRLTDQLHVLPSLSPSSVSCSSVAGGFRLISSDSRAHLQPHLVTVNDVPCAALDVRGVQLFHGDFCVLSVFVECDGLDLEQQFLERVDGVVMSCELWTKGRVMQKVDAKAHALGHKHSLIAASYAVAANTEKSV